jgi:hypothetical protein
MELIGPYLIGCVLLVGAGAIKVARPDDTARAVLPIVPRRLRPVVPFRVLRTLIRFLAAVEAVVGGLGLLLPRPSTAALVGASYFAFAGLIAYARSRGGALASCGCFGTPDTPATQLHVVIDIVIGSAAVATAVEVPATGWLMTVLIQQPLHGLPLMTLTAVGAGVTYLTLSRLAQLQAIRLAFTPSERSG